MASTTSSIPTSAPEPHFVLFARGVMSRLAIWPALRLAVDESWGGPESAEKRTWMASNIVDAFDPSISKEIPDDVYIEEMLLQNLVDEFDVMLEDGSAEVVARDVMRLWEELCRPSGSELVERWENQARKLRGTRVESQRAPGDIDADDDGESGSSSDWVDDDEREDEAPQLMGNVDGSRRGREEPEIDADGFTLVKGKGKSNHR